tara:strand:- start:284 stop:766 length:483 start_codon:yes stop_codon:yes gene_type:complete
MRKVILEQGKLKMYESIEDDIESIYPFMRQVDKIECECMGFTPKDALEVALGADAVTYTVFDSYGVPFCMLGCGPMPDGTGYIWMLGTDSVFDNKFDFIKGSRFVVNALTQPYGSVKNYVHKDNKVAIAWLKWCGAEMGRELVFSDHPFYEFTITHKEKI